MADTTRTPDSNPEEALIAFDDRTRLVLELRKQVREGTYRPDPQAIAEALMREWDLVGELLEEVDAPLPTVETAEARHATALDRFVVEPSQPDEEGQSAKAV
jgi:phosphoketolase